tara:strand:- start:4472 stop:4663 length:192 start_codon:yes stop_codon:yes gene_type:complete
MKIDFSKVTNIEMDGIDTRDYPDFCDAFISSCDYKGIEATDQELNIINEDGDFVYECVLDELH